MAYQHPEALGSAMDGQDRVVSILTMANIVGMIVGGLSVWQLTGLIGLTGQPATPRWWVQIILVLLGAGVGVMLTVRWKGLSLLDRCSLLVGYHARVLAGETLLRPDTGVVVSGPRTLTTIYRDGRAVVRPWSPEGSGIEAQHG